MLSRLLYKYRAKTFVRDDTQLHKRQTHILTDIYGHTQTHRDIQMVTDTGADSQDSLQEGSNPDSCNRQRTWGACRREGKSGLTLG